MLKRKLAILCGLFFMAAFLSSTAYVVYRSSHKCIGKGCVACRQIQNVLHLSNQEKTGAEPAMPLPSALLFLLVLIAPLFSRLSSLTPITLKVKMSC